MPRFLSQALVGETVTIQSIQSAQLQLKLEEMACLEGERIYVLHKAPFAGPIAFRVSGYTLSLRKEDADCIVVQ